MHIDLRQLRHFLALIEHRSFVAGAAAVNLSQSAFSRSIQALEQSAGCRLIDRSQKTLQPTRQGLVLLEHARRLVQGARNLANEIDQFNGLRRGQVRFGSGPAPATQLVPRAVARFIGEHPQARVQFEVDNWQALEKRLVREDIEFFVADTRHFEADPAFRVRRLQPRSWYFCCRPGHPLTQRSEVRGDDLFDYPLALTARPPNIRKLLVERSGCQDFQPTVECEHGYALLEVVRHSDAIGISGPGLLDSLRGEDALVRLEVVDLPDHLEERQTRYGVVSRSGLPPSPLAEELIALLLDCDQPQRLALETSRIST